MESKKCHACFPLAQCRQPPPHTGRGRPSVRRTCVVHIPLRCHHSPGNLQSFLQCQSQYFAPRHVLALPRQVCRALERRVSVSPGGMIRRTTQSPLAGTPAGGRHVRVKRNRLKRGGRGRARLGGGHTTGLSLLPLLRRDALVSGCSTASGSLRAIGSRYTFVKVIYLFYSTDETRV